MVTIEDILEEIVGEIQDEFDEERPEVEEESDKTYSIDGKMLLEDVNDLFGLELSSNSCDTIGGWVYSQLDYPPQLGQSVKLPKAEFLVEELDNIRITTLPYAFKALVLADCIDCRRQPIKSPLSR